MKNPVLKTFTTLIQGFIVFVLIYGGLYLCAVAYYSNPDNIDTPTMRNARRLGAAIDELDRLEAENKQRQQQNN